ncbi:hypothetical protein HFP89_08475 [Wenzhouxiangella sp. XN79A]|uniref:hypothetical protein n=1 Tax=Wenzhouxiangella sp. XN79A TaxID=2724193 RepID=UPI00144AE931|nr:hypothetical protein [Wenzhouxiangella sp. XN79A]NKI35200.1 hypothetical protein [Wenzhouxiangella sp. XN79A]
MPKHTSREGPARPACAWLRTVAWSVFLVAMCSRAFEGLALRSGRTVAAGPVSDARVINRDVTRRWCRASQGVSFDCRDPVRMLVARFAEKMRIRQGTRLVRGQRMADRPKMEMRSDHDFIADPTANAPRRISPVGFRT